MNPTTSGKLPGSAGRPREIYISGDVETDGPIPGLYSMLSFGLVVAGEFDGFDFRPRLSENLTFYRELVPVFDRYESEALAVNGLDRNRLLVEGGDPVAVMADAARWIREVAGSGIPVFVGYPAPFDWMWLFWYFTRFVGESPFGFSQCLDIKTILAVHTREPLTNARRRFLPSDLRSDRPHTHHALDDAGEQGELFVKLFARTLSRRNDGPPSAK